MNGRLIAVVVAALVALAAAVGAASAGPQKTATSRAVFTVRVKGLAVVGWSYSRPDRVDEQGCRITSSGGAGTGVVFESSGPTRLEVRRSTPTGIRISPAAIGRIRGFATTGGGRNGTRACPGEGGTGQFADCVGTRARFRGHSLPLVVERDGTLTLGPLHELPSAPESFCDYPPPSGVQPVPENVLPLASTSLERARLFDNRIKTLVVSATFQRPTHLAGEQPADVDEFAHWTLTLTRVTPRH